MNKGLDAMWFTVREMVSGSFVPTAREFRTRAEAVDEIRTRLYDDLADSAADVTGQMSREFRAAVAGLDGGAWEIEWRGTRYWITEEHEETGW